MRALVALLTACLPVVLLWLQLVTLIDRHDAERPPPPNSPNPTKAPASSLGIAEVLVYADPSFAGAILFWVLPGAALLVGLGPWAAGVPVLANTSSAGWPPPGFLKVTGAALAVGSFLALPWVYAVIRVLHEPTP